MRMKPGMAAFFAALKRIPVECNNIASINAAPSFRAQERVKKLAFPPAGRWKVSAPLQGRDFSTCPKAGNPVHPGMSWGYWIARFCRRRHRSDSVRRESVAAAAFLAAALGGCTSSFNVVGDPFVAPAKFQFLRCEDIAKRLVTTKAREQELRTLMDRSSAGAGGSTVNLFVYQPEYQTVTSELQQLRDEAVEKQCPPEPAKTETKADAKKTDGRKKGS